MDRVTGCFLLGKGDAESFSRVKVERLELFTLLRKRRPYTFKSPSHEISAQSVTQTILQHSQS